MIGSLVPCMYWQSNPFIDHLKVIGDPNQRSKRAGSYGSADTVLPILPNPVNVELTAQGNKWQNVWGTKDTPAGRPGCGGLKAHYGNIHQRLRFVPRCA